MLDNEAIGTEIVDTQEPTISDNADELEQEVVSDEADDAAPDEKEGGPDDVEKEMKTIKKALNKKNRYIDNQRSRIRALESEIQKLQGSSKNTVDSPKMEQFDSVLEYIEAKQKHELDQKFGEHHQQQQIMALQQQQAAIRHQQDAQIGSAITELVNTSPEAKAVLSQAMPIIQQMPPHIEALMYEIDDVPMAAYALAKEGRLQDLYYMNPNVAAAELVAAQQRGLRYLQQSAKSTKKPPEPLGSIKGAGKKSTKSLSDMSGDELMKWLHN